MPPRRVGSYSRVVLRGVRESRDQPRAQKDSRLDRGSGELRGFQEINVQEECGAEQAGNAHAREIIEPG